MAIRPNYFVIGAPKAGTTSLCSHLGAHPDVFMSDPKEPQFFSHNLHRGYEWYASLFESASGHAAVGEGSTTYSSTGIWPVRGSPSRSSCAEARWRHTLWRIGRAAAAAPAACASAP